MKTFVIGDIHGSHKALVQCLKESSFDFKNDCIITLGDYCDGYPETFEVVETLLSIPNRISIMGNHDYWFYQYILAGLTPSIWLEQGGKATIKSYKKGIPKTHISFFNNLHSHLIIENNLFVHGGFYNEIAFEKNELIDFIWDRSLFELVYLKRNDKNFKLNNSFNEIFIGHTTTQRYSEDIKPLNYCNLWNLDTGAGWNGKLTIMNINTKEYWQSDLVKNLYPNYIPR